jgi:hypothetical protein
MKSYDRMDGESAKAWAAFCVYRDLGVSRSLDRAAAEIYGLGSDQIRPRNLSTIKQWSSRWAWVDRIREWDTDIEAANRAIAMQQNRDRYLAQAAKFREQTEAIGFGIIAAASKVLMVLDRIATQLVALENKPIADLTQREIELIKILPSAIKAIAGSSSGGVDLTADGLGLKDVIDKLEEDLADV